MPALCFADIRIADGFASLDESTGEPPRASRPSGTGRIPPARKSPTGIRNRVLDSLRLVHGDVADVVVGIGWYFVLFFVVASYFIRTIFMTPLRNLISAGRT
jgi:hypothetical protein